MAVSTDSSEFAAFSFTVPLLAVWHQASYLTFLSLFCKTGLKYLPHRQNKCYKAWLSASIFVIYSAGNWEMQGSLTVRGNHMSSRSPGLPRQCK